MSLVAFLAAGIVACGGGGGSDGGTDERAPDITSTSSTSSSSTSTSTPPATAGSDDGVLDAAGATAQLGVLVPTYTRAVADAVAAGALDERLLRDLQRSLTPDRSDRELRALQQAGLDALLATAPPAAVTDVTVVEASERCASGTAVVTGVTELAAAPAEVVQPFYFRLHPALDGAGDPGWRIDFLNFSNNGVPLTAEAACA